MKPQRKKPDPIFAAIRRVRRAELACDLLGDDTKLLSKKRQRELKPHADDFFAARTAFVGTLPTTPAGVAAFASYLHEAQVRMCRANPYLDNANDAETYVETLDIAVSCALGFRPWKAVPL